ncbi:MAG: 6-phosphogluconolactonase [Candidatus Omnitrophica bacterium]|nr:6-phosphogluconolactonase [Candidatus Omnitrophota bacterium]
MNRKILIFENRYSLSNFLIMSWLEKAKEFIHLKKEFTVALCGGQSPVEFYCRLPNIPGFELWRHTHVFLTDEEIDPKGKKAKHYSMINDYLLQYTPVSQKQIHPIFIDQEDVSLCLDRYEEDIKEHFEIKKGELPSFDFVLLGLGRNGEMASLFPDNTTTNNRQRLAVAVVSLFARHMRVTLTLPVINNAKNVYLVATGQKKSSMVKKILEDDYDCPASQLQLRDGELFILLDREAARELSINEDQISHQGEAIVLS